MKDKFLGKDPANCSIKWSEDHIQMYIVQETRRRGYLVTASMEQAKRNRARAARAKAMGLTAGVPDLIFRLPNGGKVEIELKTKTGKLSGSQKAFHKVIKDLGHEVYTVYAQSPARGLGEVLTLLERNKQ
jgi:hypothetical protein